MPSKTFKIGEYAKGGIITAEIKANRIYIISKEWDYSTGSSRNSDQSKAKELDRRDFFFNKGGMSSGDYRSLMDYLCDLTTSYYANEIVKWIETKTGKLQQNSW